MRGQESPRRLFLEQAEAQLRVAVTRHRIAVRPGRAAAVLLGLGLITALGGCLLGKARGDYWAGTTSGETRGDCAAVVFELMIEGGRVTGDATSDAEWGTVLWTAQGAVGADGTVTLETTAQDPRVAQRSVRWTGALNVLRMDLIETGGCTPARTARLFRR